MGRSDLQRYFDGAETIENFIVAKHGGAYFRPGTKFVAEVKTESLFTRLIPFSFSDSDTYQLEFGNLYIRFFRDKGRLEHGAREHVADCVV